jgi:hypothetical protein
MSYTHFFLTEDGRLCSTGQHCPGFPEVLYGFPQVLYNALLRIGYDGEVPIYRCCLSMTNGLDICETSMTIPLNQENPWTGTIIGSEPNSTVE